MDNHLALTVDTPRASTQPNPWGKPGGPGLWHHKDLMLPPYIQNVSKALARSGLGESEAIHRAVGIVKDWAAGRTSNGKGRVHPDVQAAAAKAMAEFEADRATAHGVSAAKGKVSASMSSLGKILQLSTATPDDDDSPQTLAAAVDACLDQACDSLHGIDLTSLPAEVQQAVALVYAAGSTVDQLLAAMGVPDPDEQPASAAMSNTNVARILALSGDSSADSDGDNDQDGDGDNDEDGEQDLNGGTLTNAGAVMMTGVGRVGMVSSSAKGKHVGVHKSGAKTPPMRSRKAAGNAVIQIHKKQQGK